MADEMKKVFLKMGNDLFSTYFQRIQQGEMKQKVNWEYVKELAHLFYSVYLVGDDYDCEL